MGKYQPIHMTREQWLAALVHAAEIIEHAGDLFDLVKAHVKILQRCREVRGLTTAESAFLARGIALLKAIGGAQ